MLRNEEGMSIVMVFGIMVILGILASALIVRTLGERQITTYIKRSETAFNAAEACLDLAISKLHTETSAIPAPPDTWAALPNNALYKTGLPDSLPEEISIEDMYTPPLWSAELVNIIYEVRTSGKERDITRSLEAGVRIGPVPFITQH